jgi:CheY-like chemotaxis protein
MNAIPVLFIGDAAWPDFRDAHCWLADHAILKTAADVPKGAELIELEPFDPQLIVLAQRWPGEFSERQSDLLRRVAPLARISELLGSWCEGQTRTGDPLSATLRYYWHQWIARLAPEFARAERGECPGWALPTTVTDEERLLALEYPRPTLDRGLLTIHTRGAETAAALCAAAASRGFGAVWIRSRRMPQVSGVRAAIWTAARGAAEEARELAEWRAILGGVPIVALVNFPRIEDRELLLAAGATLVVSKPFWLDDLFGPLERLLDGERQALR